MNEKPQLPPFRVIERTLRNTTEYLATELRTPSAHAPDWDEFEWNMARAVAVMHGISPLLAHRLRWRGPPYWRKFLDQQLEQGVLRDERIQQLKSSIDHSMRQEGVSVVALKGAALTELGIYAPGERPMGDIDLLARPEDFPDVERALAAMNFHHAFTMKRHTVFGSAPLAPPQGFGEHIDNPLLIEVHGLVTDELPEKSVDITASLLPREATPGMHGYPSHSALLAHLLLHAAGNMRAHALRLVQLEDISRVIALIGDEAWPWLLGQRDDPRLAWWALPPLLLAERYCDAAIPRDVIARLRAACSLALGFRANRYTLNEVSWTNLRIAAFPGIEWSQSVAEALRYARSRLMPNTNARHELDLTLVVLPQLKEIPWYQLSHRSRILRWLFTRPPRVQAMNTVMASLAQGPQISRG